MTNQYRCETCGNKEPIPTPRWASETPLRLGEQCKITKKKCKRKFTSVVGCASHSDLQYQCGDECKGECSGEIDGKTHCPYPKQNEQEIVLDKFVDWCSSFDDYTCGSVFTPSFVLKKLKALRQDEQV